MSLSTDRPAEVYRDAWLRFVGFISDSPTRAELASYAAQSGQSFDSVQRKAWAVEYALRVCELDVSSISALGQSQTLSRYAKWCKSLKEPRKDVTLGVRESQKPILQMQIERIKEILRSKQNPATTEEFADWLASHLEQLSDAQIRNEAQGVGA